MSLLLAAGGPSAYWYLTRGTGVVALLLLTAGVVLGVLSSTHWASPRWPRFVVAGLHRNLTLLALAFVAVHVLTTVLDSFTPIGLRDAVIPFVTRYRPVWVGLGAVAFDLLLALIVTSLLRARLGFRTWKLVHWLAYISWPVALVHSFGTGSDARTGWFGLLALASVAVVVLSVIWRVVEARSAPGAYRLAGGLAAFAVPLAIAAWAVDGPLASGWARRAGTPSSILSAASARTRGTAVETTSALPQTPYDSAISGTYSESGPDESGLVTVSLEAAAGGGSKGVVHVTLQGVPLEGGGVQMTGSSVTFGPQRSPRAYSGRIDSLEGSRVAASVSNSSGHALGLTLVLRLDSARGTLSGLLHVE
jgi:hypothetical protein